MIAKFHEKQWRWSIICTNARCLPSTVVNSTVLFPPVTRQNDSCGKPAELQRWWCWWLQSLQTSSETPEPSSVGTLPCFNHYFISFITIIIPKLYPLLSRSLLSPSLSLSFTGKTFLHTPYCCLSKLQICLFAVRLIFSIISFAFALTKAHWVHIKSAYLPLPAI